MLLMKGDKGQTRREVEEHDRGRKTHTHLAGRGGKWKEIRYDERVGHDSTGSGIRRRPTLMQVNKHRHTWDSEHKLKLRMDHCCPHIPPSTTGKTRICRRSLWTTTSTESWAAQPSEFTGALQHTHFFICRFLAGCIFCQFYSSDINTKLICEKWIKLEKKKTGAEK